MDGHRQITEAQKRQRNTKPKRVLRLHPAVGQGAPARALHFRVDLALNILIQRERARGGERCADQHLKQMQIVRDAPGTGIITDEGGDQYH